MSEREEVVATYSVSRRRFVKGAAAALAGLFTIHELSRIQDDTYKRAVKTALLLDTAGGTGATPSSGSGAPTNASYVTIVAEAGLSNESLHDALVHALDQPPQSHDATT